MLYFPRILPGVYIALFSLLLIGCLEAQRAPTSPATGDGLLLWLSATGSSPGSSPGIAPLVAVGQAGTNLWSFDSGETWTAGGPMGGVSFNNVGHGDGVFIAVRNAGEIRYTSDNGATWDTGTGPGGSDDLQDVAYDGTNFCAVGVNGVSGRIFCSSDDGATWVDRTPGGVGPLSTITSTGPGEFLALGDNGDPVAWRSINGGTTWGSISISNDLYFQASVTGGGGTLAVGDDGSSNGLAQWYDGSTFNPRNPSSTSELYGVAFDGGAGRFVAINSTAERLYTDDAGVNWSTPVAVGAPGFLLDIVYANGRFITVGTSGAIYWSIDGTSWNDASPGGTYDLRGIAAGEPQ